MNGLYFTSAGPVDCVTLAVAILFFCNFVVQGCSMSKVPQIIRIKLDVITM